MNNPPEDLDTIDCKIIDICRDQHGPLRNSVHLQRLVAAAQQIEPDYQKPTLKEARRIHEKAPTHYLAWIYTGNPHALKNKPHAEKDLRTILFYEQAINPERFNNPKAIAGGIVMFATLGFAHLACERKAQKAFDRLREAGIHLNRSIF